MGLRYPSLGPTFHSGALVSFSSSYFSQWSSVIRLKVLLFIVELRYPSLGPTFHSGVPLSVSRSYFSQWGSSIRLQVLLFIVELRYPSLGPTFHSGAPLSVSRFYFSQWSCVIRLQVLLFILGLRYPSLILLFILGLRYPSLGFTFNSNNLVNPFILNIYILSYSPPTNRDLFALHKFSPIIFSFFFSGFVNTEQFLIFQLAIIMAHLVDLIEPSIN